mmetsp:Transcript_28806/g.67013  ORF Transcript_28806/g.67013 Transcript_28806/m.67013 type:complete len:268 (+) Transcript_28806:1809-2612(+)
MNVSELPAVQTGWFRNFGDIVLWQVALQGKNSMRDEVCSEVASAAPHLGHSTLLALLSVPRIHEFLAGFLRLLRARLISRCKYLRVDRLNESRKAEDVLVVQVFQAVNKLIGERTVNLLRGNLINKPTRVRLGFVIHLGQGSHVACPLVCIGEGVGELVPNALPVIVRVTHKDGRINRSPLLLVHETVALPKERTSLPVYTVELLVALHTIRHSHPLVCLQGAKPWEDVGCDVDLDLQRGGRHEVPRVRVFIDVVLAPFAEPAGAVG